jgi:hypothetical protein
MNVLRTQDISPPRMNVDPLQINEVITGSIQLLVYRKLLKRYLAPPSQFFVIVHSLGVFIKQQQQSAVHDELCRVQCHRKDFVF